MIKLIKKHWNKLLLLQFIAIALICVFTSKTYAYTLDNDGNLVSQNLFDLSKATQFGSMTINNGVVSGSDSKNYFAFMVQTIDNNNNITDVYGVNVYSIGIQHYTFNKTSSIKAIQFGHNGSTNDIKLRYDISSLSNNSYTISINILSINNPKAFGDIMLNVGSTALAYEPYGTWYNQQDYDQLQGVVNGVQYGTLQYLDYMEFKDSVTQEPIEKDGLTEFSLDYLKEHNAVSNSGSLAVNYFVNSTTNPNEHSYTIVMYFNTQLSINMLSMMFTSYATGTIEVYGNASTIINFSDSNQLIDYQDFNGSSINYITDLYINFSSADAISNISFNSFASQSYQYGFDYGQTIGDQKGYDRGYEQGNADGYQRGYNEGAEQDFESGGMKILFNSILSYPVNLIRSVFDFEFMGINVASLVMFIVSIGIVAFVISKFL